MSFIQLSKEEYFKLGLDPKNYNPEEFKDSTFAVHETVAKQAKGDVNLKNKLERNEYKRITKEEFKNLKKPISFEEV